MNAAGEIVALNVGVWAADRYVLHKEGALISWQSVQTNFRKGFTWDNTPFHINFIGHPYHGGLYYNAARTNGMTYKQSIPWTIGGSLMWEFFMENRYPALNDFVATTIGGMCLGETTYRISNLFIDNRSKGLERAGRELCAALINPIQGLNRLLRGEMWQIQIHKGALANPSYHVEISSGYRGLLRTINNTDNGAFAHCRLLYGTLFSAENALPYEAFSLSLSLNALTRQTLITDVQITGELWRQSVALKNKQLTFDWGIFQHFDYYSSEAIARPQTEAYQIAEVAAFGSGCQFTWQPADKIKWTSQAFLNATLLGSNATDYYALLDPDEVYARRYNFGSGYSAKLHSHLNLRQRVLLTVVAEHYTLFTWKGYSPDTDLSQQSYLFSTMGDKGHTFYSIVKFNAKCLFYKNLLLSIGFASYPRRNHYAHFSDVLSRVIEHRIGIGVRF